MNRNDSGLGSGRPHMSAIALNNAGRPCVSYYGGGNLRYGEMLPDITWDILTVDSDYLVGGHTSIVTNSAGDPSSAIVTASTTLSRWPSGPGPSGTASTSTAPTRGSSPRSRSLRTAIRVSATTTPRTTI